MPTPCAKPVLLVEDDPVDAQAIQRALQTANETESVIHVPCAQEALAHLRSPETSRPALILLDLSLPGTSGLEFIQVVKSDPCLRNIPIVVLTGSNKPSDIHQSFDLGIAGYMVKSTGYDGLLETIRTIQSYWSLSQFPAYHTA